MTATHPSLRPQGGSQSGLARPLEQTIGQVGARPTPELLWEGVKPVSVIFTQISSVRKFYPVTPHPMPELTRTVFVQNKPLMLIAYFT